MAAIDQLRQAVQDARSLGLWRLPASVDTCFPASQPPTTDQQKFLVLAVLSLHDLYQQVQQNTADIAAIKTKIGL